MQRHLMESFLDILSEKTTCKVYVIDKKEMESTYVTFDDSKYPGLEEDEDETENAHLRFKN